MIKSGSRIKSKRFPKNISIRTICAFLLSLSLCFSLVFIIAYNLDQIEELTMEHLITEKSARINDVMLRLLLRTQTLSSYIKYNNGDITDFIQVASMLIDDPAIENILIAPGGVVTEIYPLRGNEAVLGLDFFSESAGNREAQIAVETGQLVLGGPFQGVQGDQIMVGRLPVYINEPDGTERFWGLVSVTLAYPQVLHGAGLEDLAVLGFDYELWRKNPDNNEMQIIAHSEHVYNEKTEYLEVPISILNADWYFRIMINHAWYTHIETWISAIAGICISFLIAVVVQYAQDIKKMKDVHDRSVLENHMVAMKLLVSSLEQQDNTARQHRKESALFKHDIKHLGSMILYNINTGDTDGARKLINEMDASIREFDNTKVVIEITGHKLIDATLCHSINTGRSSGIDVNIKMQELTGTDADLTELAVTLANIMDNAMNACMVIPEGSGRIIEVNGSRRGEQYFIEVANTCAGEVFFNPETELPMRQDKSHGFGCQSIAYFAQKHGASLQYKYEANWFYVRLLI